MPFFPFVIYSAMMVNSGLILEYLLSVMEKQTNKNRKSQISYGCTPSTRGLRERVDAHRTRTDPGGLYESICNQVICSYFYSAHQAKIVLLFEENISKSDFQLSLSFGAISVWGSWQDAAP